MVFGDPYATDPLNGDPGASIDREVEALAAVLGPGSPVTAWLRRMLALPADEFAGELLDQLDGIAAAAGAAEAPPAGATPAVVRTWRRALAGRVLRRRMAGASVTDIAREFGLPDDQVWRMIRDNLTPPADSHGVEVLRALESARYDAAQAAIWSDVVAGDSDAITVFLRISSARRRLLGLDKPARVEVAVGVRAEADAALTELAQLVSSLTIPGEVINRGAG